MSLFSNITKDISYGPLALVGGGLALLSYFAIEEYLITKYNRPELYSALNNLESKSPEDREKAALFILDYVANKEVVAQQKDPQEEKKDILYEHSALKRFLNVAELDNNTEKTLQCVLICIRELTHGPVGIERRCHFNMNLKGLPTLLALCFSGNEKVEMAALRALKSATTFEVAKKELEDDVPRGSEGGSILLRAMDKDVLTSFVAKLEDENTEILRGVTSIISHISNSYNGASMLSQTPDAVPLLLTLVISHVENICKNAIIALSNIAKVNFAAHEDALLTVLKPILKSLNNQTKTPQKIAILEFMSALSQHMAEKDIDERDKVANLLLELREQVEYLFRLAESETPLFREAAKTFAHFFTQPDFTNEAEAFSSIETIIKQRMKMEQEEKIKKMVQSMRQMGIDIPPHVLATMSPNDIQQLYFQMMSQIGMM